MTWMTIRDVAEHYAVSTRTVRTWLSSGKLRAARGSPRLIRIHVDDLALFERSYLQRNTSPVSPLDGGSYPGREDLSQ